MYAVLNDFSLQSKYTEKLTKDQATAALEQFAKFIEALKEKAEFEGLVAYNSDTIWSAKIAGDITWIDWLNDNSIRNTLRQYWRTTLSKVIKIESTRGDYYFDFQCHSSCKSAAVCFEYDNTVFTSIITAELWKQERYTGKYMFIDEDDKIVENSREIKNYFENTQIDSLLCYVRARSNNGITSGIDLWNKRKELYPNLEFCSSVYPQLIADGERFHILSIMKRLDKLQDFFSKDHNYYDPKELGLDARTESDSVKDCDELKSKRLFELPDGSREFFYDHIGFSGKYSGRIHFLPVIRENKCYIGYIGRHLPTKNY